MAEDDKKLADLTKWKEWSKVDWDKPNSRAGKVESAFTAIRLLQELPEEKRKKFRKKLTESGLMQDIVYTAQVVGQNPEEARKVQYYLESGKAPPEQIENVALEGVTRLERVIAKNSAKDKDVALKFYGDMNADHEFINYYGSILGRKKGSNTWYPVDPKGLGDGDWWDKTKEAGFDVVDVFSDIGQGTLETAGAALGGTAGFFAGGGAGALAGGVLGGGTAAALSDYLRTSTGQAAGLAQEPTWKSAGDAFATGALATSLFGTGATKPFLKSMMKKPFSKATEKLMKKRNLTEREVLQRLTEAQSGVPVRAMRGGSEVSMGIGGSSLDRPAQGYRELKALKEYNPEYKAAAKMGEYEAAENIYKISKKRLGDRKKQLQKQLAESMGDKYVDIEPLRNKMFQLVMELPADSERNRQVKAKVYEMLQQNFPTNVKGKPINNIPLERAVELKFDLISLDKEYKNAVASIPSRDISSGKAQVKYSDIVSNLTDDIDKKIDEVIDVDYGVHVKGPSVGLGQVGDGVAVLGEAQVREAPQINYADFLSEWKTIKDAERALGKKPNTFAKKVLNATSEGATGKEFRKSMQTVDKALGGTDTMDAAIGVSLADKYSTNASPLPVAKDGGELSTTLGRKTVGGMVGGALGTGAGYVASQSFGLPPQAMYGGGLIGGAAGFAAMSPKNVRRTAEINRAVGAPFRALENVNRPFNPGVVAAHSALQDPAASLTTYGDMTGNYMENKEIPYAYSPWLQMPEYRRNLGLSPYQMGGSK